MALWECDGIIYKLCLIVVFYNNAFNLKTRGLFFSPQFAPDFV